jgi:cytochrome c553
MKKLFLSSALFFISLTHANAYDAIAAGKAAASKYNCAACHGANFDTPVDPSYPKLAGQHKDYLEHALVSYQRSNKLANSRDNAIMGGIAKQLTRQEIKDIAAYLSSLPGTLVLRK